MAWAVGMQRSLSRQDLVLTWWGLREGSGYEHDRVNCDDLIVSITLCWTLLNVPERRLYRYLSTVNHSVSRDVLPHERLENALRVPRECLVSAS